MHTRFTKRIFLDADIIIKTTKSGTDLLEKMIDLFDECYLHERVYSEAEFPTECQKILDDLISKNKISLITDQKLFQEVGYKSLFLLTLEQACNIFNKNYYNNLYSHLQSIDNDNLFLQEVENIGNELNDIGEIRTLQMIISLFSIPDTDNYILSDDRRARNGFILHFSNHNENNNEDNRLRIQGIPLMTIFHYLKGSISEEEALSYANLLSITNIRIYNEDGSRNSVSKEEFIRILYNEEYHLQKTGYIQLL